MLLDQRPLLVLQFVIEHFQQAAGGFLAVQSAQLVQRLPLQIEQLLQFLVAAVGVFDAFGQFALGGFDHLFLFAHLLALLLDGVLPLVERAFPFVQFLPHLREFFFAGGLLLDGKFFDFQLGFFFAILGLAVGIVDNAFGFGFRIFSSQPIQQADDDECHPRRQRRRNDNGNRQHRDPIDHAPR